MLTRLKQLRARWRMLYRTTEDSLRLRQMTFAAQTVGILALAYTTRLWYIALPAVILLAIGHRSAYHAHGKPNYILRIGVFFGVILSLCWLMTALLMGLPFPQVHLAFMVTAIVSFELFSRVNLYSGMGLGLLNLYAAATVSRDIVYGGFLVVFIVLVLAFLWVADHEDGLRDNPVVLRPTTSQSQGNTLGSLLPRFGLGLLVVTAVIFFFLPRYGGQPLWRPMSLQLPIRQGASSQIINPAVPIIEITGIRELDESEYYFGFESSLDLSYRGGLSDTIMMYVRSPAWSYWRSHAYDTYDGRLWSTSNPDDVTVIERDFETLGIPIDKVGPDEEIFIQTFYIVQPLPNLVFAGGQPKNIYVASTEVLVDNNDGIRIGETLQPGMVYSVLSTRVDHPPDILRAEGTDYPPDITARYLQIPDIVGPEVRNLAHELTAGTNNPYDAAIAIRDHLRAEYPYDWYPPPQPPGSEACFQLLFVDGRGVCEHYVTAMIIMLRELGVPSRLAAGYGAGDFNQITGYYEVRANQAHAWVEVYFPDYGWIPFDPTPGWNGNPQTGRVNRWVFSDFAADFQLPPISLSGLGEFGMTAFSLIGQPLVFVLGTLGILALFWGLWRNGVFKQIPRPKYIRDPRRRKIFAAYRRAQRRLKSYRAPAQTVQQHATQHIELTELARAVDIAAYSPEPPDEALVRRVIEKG